LVATAAAFGVGKLDFQDGQLAGLLGFEPQGYLDAWAPILFFAMIFALAIRQPCSPRPPASSAPADGSRSPTSSRAPSSPSASSATRRSGPHASAAPCSETIIETRLRPPGSSSTTSTENNRYRFVSERADNATKKYGVKSVSLLAGKS